jgi:hypothetical protein
MLYFVNEFLVTNVLLSFLAHPSNTSISIDQFTLYVFANVSFFTVRCSIVSLRCSRFVVYSCDIFSILKIQYISSKLLSYRFSLLVYSVATKGNRIKCLWKPVVLGKGIQLESSHMRPRQNYHHASVPKLQSHFPEH